MISPACASSGISCVVESPIPCQRSLRACSASTRCAPQMLHGSPHAWAPPACGRAPRAPS
eukprot:505765-Prymnesium_polylepis.1